MKRLVTLFILACLMIASYCQSVTPSAPAIQKIGYFVVTDAEGGLTYSISAGNTGKYFTINKYSGLIEIKREAFSTFKEKRTWILTIKITDSPTADDNRVNMIKRICRVVATKTITPAGKVILKTAMEYKT